MIVKNVRNTRKRTTTQAERLVRSYMIAHSVSTGDLARHWHITRQGVYKRLENLSKMNIDVFFDLAEVLSLSDAEMKAIFDAIKESV